MSKQSILVACPVGGELESKFPINYPIKYDDVRSIQTVLRQFGCGNIIALAGKRDVFSETLSRADVIVLVAADLLWSKEKFEQCLNMCVATQKPLFVFTVLGEMNNRVSDIKKHKPHLVQVEVVLKNFSDSLQTVVEWATSIPVVSSR